MLVLAHSLLLLDRQEKFELWWQLLLAVEPVRKVDPSDPTIRMNGDPQSLNVIRTISSPCEI